MPKAQTSQRRTKDDRIRDSDDVLATLAQIKREKAARAEHPYVADIIRILAPYPSGLHRRDVIERMLPLRPPDLSTPNKFEQAVQSAFNRHCGESATFKLGPEHDVFCWPRGKDEGTWAVRYDRALAWLRARGLPEV